MIDQNRERYKELIAKCDEFELKGKNMLYTSANGHMFSQINKAGEVGLRFSPEVQEKYFSEFNTSYYLSYGAKMKGYILIPQELLGDTDKMLDLFKESYEYVMTLEPK